MPQSRHFSRDRRGFSLIFACVTALAISVLITACGGSSSNGSKGGIPNRQQAQADAVKFAKCMREHGIDAEASTGPNGSGVGLSIHVAGGPKPGAGGKEEGPSNAGPPPGVEAAQHACGKYLPNEGKPLKLSPAEEAKQRASALKFARCMRSHGVEVPDPGASGSLELGSSVDPQSATFQDAQKACESLMGKVPLRVSSSRVGPGGGQVQSEAARAGG